ncbi:hypothetical protein [Paenibacillus endoradicis]|uniref:hypothetical protein n=1 Tax=Paenibacillus endoradicis TaxID=2972487 RepID=UPI002158B683|nr:hypothetical protein [Paenibacillus endoradicis]MCR8656472.1 hypothetical protein [Paenibacillus endoradicis]
MESIAFNDAIYYFEDVDVIVIFKQEDTHLDIFDIISKHKVDYDIILHSIVSEQTEIIHFYFTPDNDNEHLQIELISECDDTLFVRPICKCETPHFLMPLTSHA